VSVRNPASCSVPRPSDASGRGTGKGSDLRLVRTPTPLGQLRRHHALQVAHKEQAVGEAEPDQLALM
jgi:hypothetical protein